MKVSAGTIDFKVPITHKWSTYQESWDNRSDPIQNDKPDCNIGDDLK